MAALANLRREPSSSFTPSAADVPPERRSRRAATTARRSPGVRLLLDHCAMPGRMNLLAGIGVPPAWWTYEIPLLLRASRWLLIAGCLIVAAIGLGWSADTADSMASGTG